MMIVVVMKDNKKILTVLVEIKKLEAPDCPCAEE